MLIYSRPALKGSLGGIFTLPGSDMRVGLTNAHVLLPYSDMPLGTRVFSAKTGKPIGRVLAATNLWTGDTLPLDAALFAVDATLTSTLWPPVVLSWPTPDWQLPLGAAVKGWLGKSGHLTGTVVEAVSTWDLILPGTGATVRYSPLFAIQWQDGCTSTGGDSGSLILTPEGQVAGLLLGLSNTGLSLACHVQPLMQWMLAAVASVRVSA